MSKMSEWMEELEEEAFILTRSEFVAKYKSYGYIWDRVNGASFEEEFWDEEE